MNGSEAIDRVIAAYGGVALWRSLQEVVLEIDFLGGPLPLIKGLGRTFARPSIVAIRPFEWRAEFRDFPGPGESAVFAAGTVQLHDRTGALTFEDRRYRERFHGLKKYRRWSHADAVYFFGYALTTYLSVPFVLPTYVTRIDAGPGGVRIEAHFPETIHTHSAKQEFWFDSEGLLSRHDYCADVVGWWATGAHFTSEYQRMGGLPVATRREVYGRIQRTVTPLPILSARLHPLEVKTG